MVAFATMRIAAVVVMLVALVACEKSKPGLELDAAALEQRIAARAAEVTARPGVVKAFDAFFREVAADRALAAAGDKVLASLAADPKLAAAGEGVLAKLEQLPALEALVRELVAAHPDANPQQISELTAQRVESAFSHPKIRATFDDFAMKLSEQLRGAGGVVSGLERRLERALRDRYEAQWTKRLAELNGGSTPSPPRVTDLLVEHALGADRLEAFVLAFLGSTNARAETAKLVAGMLVVPSIDKELHHAVENLASDPALQDEAVAIFDLLLSSQSDPVAIDARLRKLLFSPRVLGIAINAVKVAVGAPESAKLADAALAAMATDPALQKAFDELMTGW